MNDRNTGANSARTRQARPTGSTRRGAAMPRKRPARPGGPERRYAVVKWALLAALLVYGALVVRANSARDVDFSAIAERIAPAPGIDALNALDENAFQERFGTAPEGCEGWLAYGADAVMDVSELVIAKAGADVLDRLEEAVRARVDAQLDVFRSYGTDQAQLLDAAAIMRRGDYLFYGVGPNAEAWEDAFLSCIR